MLKRTLFPALLVALGLPGCGDDTAGDSGTDGGVVLDDLGLDDRHHADDGPEHDQ